MKRESKAAGMSGAGRRALSRFGRGLVVLGLVLGFSVFFAETASAAGGEHDDHHGVNWYYGNLMEKEGLEEPNLLFRPKGMPSPLSALLVNSLLLYFLIYKFGAKPIREALKKRKRDIMGGMDEAARMKADASRRLKEFEDKLKHIDDEIERIRQEMRDVAEAERANILREAKERHARMEREARLLVDQELKAAREQLYQATVRSAVDSAESVLVKKLSASDQQRIADEYLRSLDQALQVKGGQA